ncbi:MAG: co-chaperone GroES [Trueperaceae bacterium]
MAATKAATLKPIGDKIIVEVIDEPEKSAGGILLPDTAKEKSQRGKVIAVGSGRTLDNGQKVALEVKVGDTVVYAKYGGTEFKLDNKELMILAERDIHAIVE